MKLFFSHASEDKPAVLAVAAKVKKAYPDTDIWIDLYEIAPGQSLTERIADGIRRADKFFVFISKVSVNKPWVKAELSSALHDDITGAKRDFVVPVLLSRPEVFPEFLKEKLYIGVVELSEDEWLPRFGHALFGKPQQGLEGQPDNLKLARRDIKPGHIVLTATAQHWPEKVAFSVVSSAAPAEIKRFYQPHQMSMSGISIHGPARVRDGNFRTDIEVASPMIAPGTSFSLSLHFAPGPAPRILYWGRVVPV